MKEGIIGILGGMGPEASAVLFQVIIKNTEAARDQDHLRVMVDNNLRSPSAFPPYWAMGKIPFR